MKKFAVFCICLALFALYQLNGFIIMMKAFDGGYSIYYKNEKIEEEYNLTARDAFFAKIKKGNVLGESVRFIGNDKDIENIIEKLDITVVNEQNLANVRTIYGYTSRLGGEVLLENDKVNIQIAKRGGTITIGTPLIVGSY